MCASGDKVGEPGKHIYKDGTASGEWLFSFLNYPYISAFPIIEINPTGNTNRNDILVNCIQIYVLRSLEQCFKQRVFMNFAKNFLPIFITFFSLTLRLRHF